jgi:acyl carrier protein
MSIEDTLKKITNIIAYQTGISSDSITPETNFPEDLMADPFDLLEIFIEVEEEFGIDISHEDAEKILTVQQLADYAHAHTPPTHEHTIPPQNRLHRWSYFQRS